MRRRAALTVRRKLLVIAALTIFSLVAMGLVDALSERSQGRQLEYIKRDLLPLLDVGPALGVGFDRLVHQLREAVAARDLDLLADTELSKDALKRRFAELPASVPTEAVARSLRSIDAWYAVARDVSRRLIEHETDSTLPADIERMQRLQQQAREALREAVFLDHEQLADAFERVQDARRLAAALRMAVRLGLLLAVTMLVIGIGRQLLRSLRAISEGLERFGRGEFDEPVPVLGDDELADLARHANVMAGSLRRLDLRLRQRQTELEAANRELEAFSYSVSHDLRAPLRTVDGFSQALLEDFGDRLDDTGRDYLRRVRAAAQRMAQLIDDLLFLSRITRGELVRQRVDVTSLVRELAEDLARGHPDHEVELEIEPGLTAVADARLLRIALENLLSNAWKFTRHTPRPRVEVGGEQREGESVLWVRDNGAGFDMTQAQKLFTPFQRLHTASEFPGTGVGLATVRRVVHRHGGQVRAQGEPNHGATFYLSLPLREESV